MTVSPAEMAQVIKMSFWLLTHVDERNHVVQMGATWQT